MRHDQTTTGAAGATGRGRGRAAGIAMAAAWLLSLSAALPAQAQGQALGETDGAGVPVATTPPTSDPAPTTGPEGARRAAAAAFAPAPAEAARGPRKGPITGLPLPRYVSLKASKANIRRGPGLDRRVDWVFMRRGMPLEVIAEHGHWRRVRDMDSAAGWVHYSLIRGDRTAVVRDEVADIREEPSADAETIARAERGVILELEGCGADWCEVSKGRIDGWLPKTAIWGAGRTETFD